jgi:hypothetical protein
MYFLYFLKGSFENEFSLFLSKNKLFFSFQNQKKYTDILQSTTWFWYNKCLQQEGIGTNKDIKLRPFGGSEYGCCLDSVMVCGWVLGLS